MERRWIAFFLVCALAYIAYYQHLDRRARAYRAWQAEQAALETYTTDPNGNLLADSGDRATTGTVASLSPMPEAGPGEFAPLPKTITDAPTTVVTTATSRIVFSHLGAKVISWRLLSSTAVVNKEGDEGVIDGGLELVPQVGDFGRREWPLELVGLRAEAFNTEMFSLAESKGPGGEHILEFVSEKAPGGLEVRKRYTIPADGYLSQLEVSFINKSEARVPLASRGPGIGVGWLGGFGVPSVSDRVHGVERALVALGKEVVNKQFDRETEPVEYTASVAWGGVERKFFAALIIPAPDNPALSAVAQVKARNDAPEYHGAKIPPPVSLSLFSAGKELGVGEVRTLKYNVYVGPTSARVLASVNPPAIEKGAPIASAAFHSLPWGFGWARPVCMVLLPVLVWLHGAVGSWGFAIILLTCLVKIAVLPLTHKAIKYQALTMWEQAKIKPQLDEIMKKYKNDLQQRNMEMMKLYKEHGISPFGPMRGCLPMLAQMPVFVGLYVVFDQAVELRGQDFMWIADLSQPDKLFGWGMALPLVGSHFNILPILMSVTQFISMKVMQMPQTGDEMQQAIQKQMMYMMPIMFGFILYSMPSGLMLYWVVSNVWAIGQSQITKKILAKHQARLEEERSAAKVRPVLAR